MPNSCTRAQSSVFASISCRSSSVACGELASFAVAFAAFLTYQSTPQKELNTSASAIASTTPIAAGSKFRNHIFAEVCCCGLWCAVVCCTVVCCGVLCCAVLWCAVFTAADPIRTGFVAFRVTVLPPKRPLRSKMVTDFTPRFFSKCAMCSPAGPACRVNAMA